MVGRVVVSGYMDSWMMYLIVGHKSKGHKIISRNSGTGTWERNS